MLQLRIIMTLIITNNNNEIFRNKKDIGNNNYGNNNYNNNQSINPLMLYFGQLYDIKCSWNYDMKAHEEFLKYKHNQTRYIFMNAFYSRIQFFLSSIYKNHICLSLSVFIGKNHTLNIHFDINKCLQATY